MKPRKRITREKETDREGRRRRKERKREGRDRVFNGVLPEGGWLKRSNGPRNGERKKKERRKQRGCSCSVPLRLDEVPPRCCCHVQQAIAIYTVTFSSFATSLFLYHIFSASCSPRHSTSSPVSLFSAPVFFPSTLPCVSVPSSVRCT